MTRREQVIFNEDVERKAQQNIEDGMSGEDAYEKAVEDAQMAYDDAMDSRMEMEREKDWE